MKAFSKVALAAVALLSSQAAFAASGTYTKTGAGPNIYVAGTENSSFHSPPGGISTSATITSVSWSAGSYSNGWTTQNRRLCYTPPGATTYTTCKGASHKRGTDIR